MRAWRAGVPGGARVPALERGGKHLAAIWTLQLLVPADRSLFPQVEAAIRGGVTMVQLREKVRPDGETYRLGLALRELVRRAGAAFVVNDRPDLAVALRADGVHVGQDDLPVEAVRRVAPGLLVGASCHDLESARRVQDADYLGFGPVFPTPSKDDAAAPTGVTALQAVVAEIRRPLVAIGGIALGNAAQLRGSGVAGVAVISAILGTADPEAAARDLRRELGI